MSSNNGLRWNTVRILNEMADLSNQLKAQRAENLHVSCVNCDNWGAQVECCLKYNQRPPATIIAFGCNEWSNVDDDVPF